MAHWGWYWKIKQKYTPKRLCPNFICMDSFELFKNKLGVQMSMNQIAYEIPAYELKAVLLSDEYRVEYAGGCYSIPIERQACNYGGFRYFLHCPKCNKRFRKLYCNKGVFNCRKCLGLGYLTQRLRPSIRCLNMASKIKSVLENKAGSLYKKPPWMKYKTFKSLQRRHFVYYDTKYEKALHNELLEWFPSKRAEIEMLL